MIIRIIFGIILLISSMIAFFQDNIDGGIVCLMLGLPMLLNGICMTKKERDEDND